MIEEQEDISFRDHLATVDAKGKRKWIYAQKPRGRYTNMRTYVSWGFFLIFLLLPFIYVNGRPFFMFNIPDAKFIIFGQVFWPQDFFIFGLTMVSFVIFIVLFTAAFGRLFCGWVCPQTIFMEMVFRKIEYLIEGDASQQRLLKKSSWNTEKIVKKVSKHLVFFLMSFIIANFFLAYIISIKELWKIITEPVSEHFVGFLSLCVFSGVFYGVYAFFREQVCTVVCPYGRLQGVLLDQNSLIVAYDYKRGEPRGKVSQKEELGLGDCIDCLQCIKVCPTGIDIRNGTQLECVSCTACIDACDNIMEKVGRPKGLIRYASENGIENSEPLRYTTRMKLYTALLMVLLVILSTLLLTRKDIDATIMRTPGMLYQERGADSITNLYNIKVANKTMADVPMTVRMERGDGKVEIIGGGPIIVKKEGQGSGSFFIVLPKKAIHERKTELRLYLYEGEKELDHMKTNFLGPINQ
ncbi:cytochrome c oxidase accessory protein CcoG [Flavihumibacter profundi]|jgi:cytochrome c oxidase accessory protein FixG|uniref:cytochrome c oxidase accessory protein CcoG n=1 Tax=Flavihumibacter profundi TaxID=2716883 RepID=UPI001CC7320F|nr:cytochrome c oxidase accessory protein CcoG [Flavihumibacter profundi]MBZ5859511.1 cytochrome c oxidase accessory protein CcoG [Flavihumibacter profundi]